MQHTIGRYDMKKISFKKGVNQGPLSLYSQSDKPISHPHSGFGCCPFSDGGSAVAYSLFVVAPIVCVVLCKALVLFCITL